MSILKNNISVIMPAYNASAYIAEAIESIFAQTYTDFEFIIINDGSTDATEKIISSYKDPRIIYIKNEKNIGLIASLNKGLDIVKGSFIARMDADDIALPQRFEKQVRFFEKEKDLVAVGSDYFLLTGRRQRLIQNHNNSDYQKAMLLFTPCFCHPAVMMRNVFKDNSLSYKAEYKYAEDYKLWTDLAFTGRFGNVQEPLLKYRLHDTQVSAHNNKEQLKISERIRIEYYRKLGFNFSEAEIKTLNIIGNNIFIRSYDELLKIGSVLINLRDQNNVLKRFDNVSFNKLLHKFWLDSCGNTSLGLKAYSLFSRSELSNVNKTTGVHKVKLLAKCVLRKFQ